MGAERLVRRALWRLVWWRLVGDVFGFPRRLLSAVADAMQQVEMAIFYLECDAARRYELLTSVDMGACVNEEDRYEKALRP